MQTCIVVRNPKTHACTYTINGQKQANLDVAIMELARLNDITPSSARTMIEDATPEIPVGEVDKDAENEEIKNLALGCLYNHPPIRRVLTDKASKEIGKNIKVYTSEFGDEECFIRLEPKSEMYAIATNVANAVKATNDGTANTVYNRILRSLIQLNNQDELWGWMVQRVSEDEDALAEVGPFSSSKIATKAVKDITKHDEGIGAKAVEWLTAYLRANREEKVMYTQEGQEISIDAIFSMDKSKKSMSNNVMGSLSDSMETTIRKIPSTISNDSTTPCFTYVDLDLLKEGDTPWFDRWINTVHADAREEFKASIFAPFLADCKHRKAVWMHSEGYDGKSTFFNALNTWCGGRMTSSFGSSNIGADFGLEPLIGKRILLWADSQNVHALGANVIHNLTGGDIVTINRKNEKHISYTFDAMIFIAANSAPEIKLHQRNELTRILYVPFRSPTDHELSFYCKCDEDGKPMRYTNGLPMYTGSRMLEELITEMPSILYKCRQSFETICPAPHRELVLGQKCMDLMMSQCADLHGQELYTVFDENFVLDKDAITPWSDISYRLKMTQKWTNRSREMAEFKKYILREYKDQIKQTRPKNIINLTGIKIKDY